MEYKKTTARLTKHAEKRVSKRLGINKKGAIKHANEAFYGGNIIQPLNNNEMMLIEYNDFHYVFGLSGACEDPTPLLITTYTKRKHTSGRYFK